MTSYGQKQHVHRCRYIFVSPGGGDGSSVRGIINPQGLNRVNGSTGPSSRYTSDVYHFLMKGTSFAIRNDTASIDIVNLLESCRMQCEFPPKGRIAIQPKCKALPLGQIHVPCFLQNRTLCVGEAWRCVAAQGGARLAAACGGDLSSSLLGSAS